MRREDCRSILAFLGVLGVLAREIGPSNSPTMACTGILDPRLNLRALKGEISRKDAKLAKKSKNYQSSSSSSARTASSASLRERTKPLKPPTHAGSRASASKRDSPLDPSGALEFLVAVGQLDAESLRFRVDDERVVRS